MTNAAKLFQPTIIPNAVQLCFDKAYGGLVAFQKISSFHSNNSVVGSFSLCVVQVRVYRSRLISARLETPAVALEPPSRRREALAVLRVVIFFAVADDEDATMTFFFPSAAFFIIVFTLLAPRPTRALIGLGDNFAIGDMLRRDTTGLCFLIGEPEVEAGDAGVEIIVLAAGCFSFVALLVTANRGTADLGILVLVRVAETKDESLRRSSSSLSARTRNGPSLSSTSDGNTSGSVTPVEFVFVTKEVTEDSRVEDSINVISGGAR